MTKLDKTFLVIGALALMTGGMLAAFGFHGLSDSLTAADRLSWRWAVQIQSYNGLGLILVTMLSLQIGGGKLLDIARSLFVYSLFVFSGVTYLEKLGMVSESVGNVVPSGGSSFMLGWGLVAVFVFLKK